MERLLDEARDEAAGLRVKVEELEIECDRLRTSERMLRLSSITPCEQVHLKTWSRIDKISAPLPYKWRDNEDDFPEPIAELPRNIKLYDLDELRSWKKARDEALEVHRAKMLQLKREDTAFMNEFYCFEEGV
jgi:hypothetical protein